MQEVDPRMPEQNLPEGRMTLETGVVSTGFVISLLLIGLRTLWIYIKADKDQDKETLKALTNELVATRKLLAQLIIELSRTKKALNAKEKNE
jgi:hypothetical protein